MRINKNTKWIIYRFYTKSVDDPRPLIYNPRYPYWVTGYSLDDNFSLSAATIVAYLPADENLFKYWDDAFNIASDECDKIEFTDRYPKPDDFKE